MVYLFQLFYLMLDADFLRSTGKIYVVALVSLIVWFGVLWYLIKLERKLKDMDDQMK